MKIRLDVKTEYGTLRDAIIGLPNTFNQTGRLTPINDTEEYYFNGREAPKRGLLTDEVHALARVLREHGVKVHYPKPLRGTIDQLTPRDLGFVIGDTFVISHMAYRIREREEKGILKYVKHFDGRVIKAPSNAVIEGGDILVDGHDIYVGVGQRTNKAGYEFIKSRFGGEYKVWQARHNALHLDCVFNILGGGRALVYSGGFKNKPGKMLERFRKIRVGGEEAAMLATNTLSISEDTVISRKTCVSTNSKLRSRGYDVIELEFNEVNKTGGSFRCCTLPLSRGI
ncbi:MAG: arginine deiminase family protein [Candidatus Altiarchaeota archaeon]